MTTVTSLSPLLYAQEVSRYGDTSQEGRVLGAGSEGRLAGISNQTTEDLACQAKGLGLDPISQCGPAFFTS